MAKSVDLQNSHMASISEGGRSRAGRVLLVDDSPLVRDIVGGLIMDWGYEVERRETGKTALQAIESISFDVVVADIDMPEMSGLELLTTLRVHAIDIPVIMLSSATRMSEVLGAIHQGAFDYVAKDEAIEPLRVAIQRAMNHVHLVAQNRALLQELDKLNAEMEIRVRQRTREIETVNNRLIIERGELEQAVARLNDTQEQLVQMEKMASVGLLTAGIAHEINNPLAFVLPNFQQLEEWIECQRTGIQHESIRHMEDVKRLVSECRRGLDRIVRIIKQLRIFSHPSQQDLTPLELGPIVRSVFALVDQELHGRVSLVLDSEEIFKVRANEDQLRQILLNLIINSAHSIPPSRMDGKILVHFEPQGSYVIIQVTDNGCGIPAENLRRVFDPFFTTKPVGQGTGMGLAIVRDLITKMGGSIVLESKVDQGTCASLTLPAWSDPQVMCSLPPVKQPPTQPLMDQTIEKSQRISIVIIEDEISLLLPMRKMLAKEYDVLTFSDSLEGLRCLMDREPPDVIICDLNMPVMNGLELWRTVTAAKPYLAERFLFFTGGDSENLLGANQEATHRVLEKPVSRSELVAAIRSIVSLPKTKPLLS